MSELGRVVDPDELERADGPVGRLTVDVTGDWLDEGAEIEVVVPKRIACARCEGGGCDQCERSGAFRLELDESVRTLTITLSRKPEKKGLVVRLQHPFGEDTTIEQLWIELRESEEPSTFVRKLSRVPSASRAVVMNPAAILLVVAFAILLAVLLSRR